MKQPFAAAVTALFASTCLMPSAAHAAPTYILGNMDPTTANLSDYYNHLSPQGSYVGAFEATGSNWSGPSYGSK